MGRGNGGAVAAEERAGRISLAPHKRFLERLVASMNDDRWGDLSPSVYETSRVVAFAPWLAGHESRIDYLLREQAADGGWDCGPNSYRLIPTLSTVSALLSVLRSQGPLERLISAIDRGLSVLRTWRILGFGGDTVAAEILVPQLVRDINGQLDRLDRSAGLNWDRCECPRGYDPAIISRLRARLAGTAEFPAKLNHTFEAVADYFPGRVQPETDGLLGGSAAATAAWIGRAPPSSARRRAAEELGAVARRYGGLFPASAPFATVERLWVLATVLATDTPSAVLPADLPRIGREWVAECYDRRGVPGVPGIPPDADDTAVALWVAAVLGVPRHPESLTRFETPTHFACYFGEDTSSVSANAHVLRALTAYPALSQREVIGKVRSWLLEQQRPAGFWTDKWHASGYYATARCVDALMSAGADDARVWQALVAARNWVEKTRRGDGGWGRWASTAEESAYAVQVLLRFPGEASRLPDPETLSYGQSQQHRPLWHDKTLYAPNAIINAELAVTSARLVANVSRRGAAHG